MIPLGIEIILLRVTNIHPSLRVKPSLKSLTLKLRGFVKRGPKEGICLVRKKRNLAFVLNDLEKAD